MPLIVADRVQETTTTVGTGTITLAGAKAGYRTFGSVMANADTAYYAIVGPTEWEVGLGTYTTAGNTFARTTVIASSAGGTTRVNFSAGIKDVFLTAASQQIPPGNPELLYVHMAGDTMTGNLQVPALGVGTTPNATTSRIRTSATVGGNTSFSSTDSTLTVNATETLTAGRTYQGAFNSVINNLTSAATAGQGVTQIGSFVQCDVGSGAANSLDTPVSTVRALDFRVRHNSSGTIGTGVGVFGQYFLVDGVSGACTNANGGFLEIVTGTGATGTITNSRGLRATHSLFGNSPINNAQGVRTELTIASQSAGVVSEYSGVLNNITNNSSTANVLPTAYGVYNQFNGSNVANQIVGYFSSFSGTNVSTLDFATQNGQVMRIGHWNPSAKTAQVDMTIAADGTVNVPGKLSVGGNAVTRSAPTASASTVLTTIQSYPVAAGEITAGSEYEFFASLRVINTTTATNAVVTLSVGATNVLVLTQAIGTTAAAAPGAAVAIRGRITFASATSAECEILAIKQAAVAFTALANTSAPVTVSAAGATTIDLKFNTSGATSTFIARQATIHRVK